MILRMPRCASALIVGAVTVVLALQASAQKCGSDAQSTIATDRPQVTASSIVVPCGSLQFENGFLVTGNGQASMYFDRQLTQAWDAWAEYSGSFPQRGGPQNLIDAGSSYTLSPHQQLDFRAVFGLSAAVPDYAIGLGYSFSPAGDPREVIDGCSGDFSMSPKRGCLANCVFPRRSRAARRRSTPAVGFRA